LPCYPVFPALSYIIYILYYYNIIIYIGVSIC
jgi:hypothetical protein